MSFVHRWLPPVVLFGVAAYVWNFNQGHSDTALLFPLLDEIPALRGEIALQAQLSWILCVVFGALATVHALWRQLWPVPEPSDDEEET